MREKQGYYINFQSTEFRPFIGDFLLNSPPCSSESAFTRVSKNSLKVIFNKHYRSKIVIVYSGCKLANLNSFTAYKSSLGSTIVASM